MGFFVDLGTCWALGALFWVTLQIFSNAYVTIYRFFGKIFEVRYKMHYGVHRIFFSLFRISTRSKGSEIGLLKTLDSESVISSSPVRTFLVICAPWLCGTGLIFAIRMYLGNGTQERLYIQIALIVVLLIAIFPSKDEQLFVLQAIFHDIWHTPWDVVILLSIWVIFVKKLCMDSPIVLL